MARTFNHTQSPPAAAYSSNPIPVVDVFAGPGGLGEGFSAIRSETGHPRFRLCLSIEKDPRAHRTLQIRSFWRQFLLGAVPTAYYDFLRGDITQEELFKRFPLQAKQATTQAWLAELGRVSRGAVRTRIQSALSGAHPWVLIGGPPCQAYSIVGRSRNKGNEKYKPEEDKRHRLYRQYLKIIADHWPAVFVMENVKGLLSSTVKNERIFERVLTDLETPARAVSSRFPSKSGSQVHRYKLHSLVERTMFSDGRPEEFIVRSELYGVPQARHRVILVGVRDDLPCNPLGTLKRCASVPAGSVFDGLPKLRSRLSRLEDTQVQWLSSLKDGLRSRWLEGVRSKAGIDVYALMVCTLQSLRVPKDDAGSEFVACKPTVSYLSNWFIDEQLGGICNHTARAHIVADLFRYLYAASFAKVHGRSPDLRDFPEELLPEHKNVGEAIRTGLFDDRFRVQLRDRPAATVTSHLCKDGHYFIHPDPCQCRSLTVREAARLQTFPDNYFFAGPRTSQYIQVGNAVPPLLAKEIAEIVLELLDGTDPQN